MFESVIQKILLLLFGRFIEGLDRKQISLSLSSGDLVIENVSIKREALEALQLPITLVYSAIQRIEVKLPWKNLNTQRTEIKIHSVFLLVTTLQENMWRLNEINCYKPKAEQVRAYIKKIMDDEVRKQKLSQEEDNEGQQQTGFFQKHITRIVDNLYIQIQQVHFRYEHCISKHSFSWGITINQITQQTVDSEWKTSNPPYFHDRKELTFVNKQIQLSKLAMYWNSDDHFLILNTVIKEKRLDSKLDEKTQAKIQQLMQQELVYEPDNSTMGIRTNKSSKYIFCLNAVANVVQTYLHARKVPEYKVKIELQEMDFKIKHTQYKEIMKQLSIFNRYQFEIKQRVDSDLTIVSKPQQQNYKLDTMRLYYRKLFVYLRNSVIMELRRKKFMEIELKALRSKTSPNIMLQKQENRKDMRPYQNIIRRTELSMLQMWAKQALEIHQSAKENYQIEQALKKEFERAYKPAHPDEETYVYLEFRLLIIKGSLKLMRKHKNLEEGFTLLWKNFDYNLQMRKNNFEIEQVIQDMEVQMFSVEEKNDIIVPIVKKIKSYEIEDKPLIYFKLEKHPLQKPNYFSSIQLEVQKIEVMVFVASLRRVMAYFRTPPQDDRQQEVKGQKQTKQPTTDQSIEPNTKNYISITIQSPIVIVPNQQINDLHSDCWVLKLGDFEIITVEEKQQQQQVLVKLSSDQSKRARMESLSRSRIIEQPLLTVHNERNQLVSAQQFNFNVFEKPPPQQQLERSSLERSINLQQKIKNAKYDHYVMKLKSVQLQYFSSIHYFYNYQKLSQTKKGMEILNNNLRVRSKKYDVLEEFSMELNLFFSKATGQAQTKVNFELPYLKASINPEIPFTVSKLLQTINDLSQDQSLSSILQQEKAKLIKYSSCRGLLRKRGKFLRSWSSYFAVLSGWYIYLYQNESDVDYCQYVGLRDVVVSEAQNDIGVMNSFKIKSKKEIIYFQAKSPQEKNRWFKFIQQKIHDIKSKTNIQKIGSENTVQQQADKNKPQNEQKELSQDNQDLVTRYRFQIKKFIIELKYSPTQEILIAFDQIKLKSLSGLSEGYQEFSINFISVVDQGLSILRSIQYSQPATPLNRNSQAKKVKNHTVIQFKTKMESVRQFQKDSQPITDALKVRISQFDSPEPNTPSTFIVIEFSSLEARYLESFLSGVSRFMVQPSLQKNSKESTTDLDNFVETQNQTIKYSAMPVSETRYLQTKQDYTRANIKSIRSFTLQKSSVSDSEVHELIQKDADQPQNIMKITIVTQEIKLIVMIQDKDKEKENAKLQPPPYEFLEIWVQQISSTLKLSDDYYDIEGEIQTIEIIDLKSINQRHVFLGKNDKQHRKIKSMTIFSNLPRQEDSMLRYGYKKFKFPSEEFQDRVYLKVKNCFIDYLHATIVKVLSLLEIAQRKKTQEENEYDLEVIKQRITSPALIVVNIEFNNPRILIKPAGQETQSFELQIEQISFDLSASKEKSRILEQSIRVNKKQIQSTYQLDALWCQTIVICANTMHIQIRNADELHSISNQFSGVLRLQTPMFVTDYEQVFPNIVINKMQEIRIKVTDIQLNIQRNHYLFLLQVMQTQYQIQTLKTQQKKKQPSQPKKQPSQIALIFKLSSVCVKLIEIFEDQDLAEHQHRPLVDLTLMDIMFSFKQNIELQIRDFKSTYYQYLQDLVRIQSTINSLHVDKKRMEFFFQEDKKQQCKIEDLINDTKFEFYKEQTPQKIENDDKEKLNVKVILGEDLTEVNIRIGEQKYLLSSYYMKTIQQFFSIPKDEDENKSQDAPVRRVETKQKQQLLTVNISISNNMFILHTDQMRNCLVLQIDSNLKMVDELYNEAHKEYHDKQNEPYNGDNKARKTELSINLQLFNCQYLAIQKSKTFRKKMILNKIKIEFLRHQFTCECQNNYCNYNNEHESEQIASFLTLDQLKFDKIRINISHNDYALITSIIKFQKEQLKLCENFFNDDDESSVHETMAKLLPLKPSLHPEADKSLLRMDRIDTKKRSTLHQKSLLIRSKSSLQSSYMKDEVAQVFYAAEDMEVVKEEDNVSDFQDQPFEVSKPIVKINKMELNLDFLEIVLVNDNNKSFAPLLLFRFNIKNFLLDQNYVSMALKFQFLIELMYFNPVVSRMEPVIDPYSSELLMVKQKSQMQTIHINSITPVLNINLAAEMAMNLYKTFIQWQSHDDQGEDESFKRYESKRMTRMASMKAISSRENQDSVTLFSLINKTGYSIRVSKTDNNDIFGDISIELLNNDSKNYEVFSHDEDYEKTFESDTKITIKFLDALMSQTIIQNVPINYAGVKKLLLNEPQFYVLSTQIENLQKTITIYSPYMIVNHTDCELQIKLSDIKNTRTYKLKPGDQAAVPQELYKDDCYVQINFVESKFTRSTSLSEPIFIKRIFNEIVMEIYHKPCYTLATVNTTLVQNVKFIEFKPAFILYNLLPIPLQFLFHSPQNQELQRNLINHFKQPNSSGIHVFEKQHSALSRGNSLTHLQNDNHDNLIRSVTVTEFNYNSTIRIDGGLIEVVPQGELQLHCLEKTEQLFANIHLSGFELSKQIDLGDVAEVELRDSHNSNICHVRAEKEVIKQTKLIYFSVHTCIINTTYSKLKYYTLNDGKPQLLPGQQKELRPDRESFESNYDKIQVTDSIKYLMIGMEDGISNEVNVGLLGSVGLQLKQKSGNVYQLHEFGIHISLANNVIKKGVYTKVIEIMPRFVVINNTGVNIQICQSGFENQYVKLNQNERYHLIWPDCRLEKSIRIQKQGKYNWSGDLFINEIRSTSFYSSCQNENSQQLSNLSFDQQRSRTIEKSGIYKQFNLKKYDPQDLQQFKEQFIMQTSMLCQSNQDFFKDCLFLTAEITRVKATNFILLEQQNEENQLYKLVNRCRPFKLFYGQDCYNSTQEWVLDVDQSTPFSWEQPSHSYKLRVKFVYNNKIEHTQVIDFQQQEGLQEISFGDHIVRIKSEFQGQTRVITFQQINESMRFLSNSHNRGELDEIKQLIQLNITQLGISIITNIQNKLFEANYVYLSGIEVGIMQTQRETTAQLRVKFLNIDNNTSLDTTTPVMMTMRRYYQVTHDRNYYFLDASCSLEHQVKAILLYNSIRIYIQPFQLQFDEEYIQVILQTVKQIKCSLQNQFEFEYNGSPHSIKSLCFQTPQQRHYYLESMQQLHQSNPCILWKSIEINRSKKQVYIKEFVLSKIDLRFSFHKRFRNNIQYDENVFNLFSTAIGATVQNFNDAEIILDCFRLRQVYDSKEIVLGSIQDHYKSEIIRAILKIIGSIEIIGNPVKFVQQITNGIVDFVEMPIEGLKHGPLEFGVGLCKGTGSLIKNTVAGAFQSVNKVTGSISASVSLLTMDDDYLEKRRIFMLKRPDHVLDGLSQAGHCLYSGFTNGITGVVMQPYQETQKDGFKGLVKGTLKGLSGLVVKPIAGVLDASAKAAEGVVSTATHFDDKPNDTRIRYPRVFYEKSQYYQKYIPLDSQVQNFLITFSNGRYKDIELITCFSMKETEQQLNSMQRQILSATKSIHECFKQTSKILILSYQYILVLENMTLLQEIVSKEVTRIYDPNIVSFDGVFEQTVNLQLTYQISKDDSPDNQFGQLKIATEFKKELEINILLTKKDLNRAQQLLKYLFKQVGNEFA